MAIADYENARDGGENPAPAAWLARYPEIATELNEFFRGAAAFGQLFGPVSSPVPQSDTGLTFKDYEILDTVNSGGMGVVYRARQRSANRTVALKVIRPDRLEGLSAEARRQAILRFQTEAQAAAQLQHEHIVGVYEVGEIDGRPFYSMRLVEGVSLADLLKQGPLEGRRAAGYLEKVARAVHEAHRHGILHRDLKPHNVLVERHTDQPLVADFGLAKLLQGGGEITHTTDVLGTPPYMSPEQAQGSAGVTVASDVYSLGATLYALLVGRPPFQAATSLETLQLVIHASVVPPRSLQPGVSRDLETICLKCLEKEPGRRYGSALALAEELQRYLEGRPIEARPVGALERGWRWCRRNRLVAGLMAAVLVTLVAGSIVSGYLGMRANANAVRANDKANEAVQKTDLANRHWYRAEIQLAQAQPADSRMKRLLDDVWADHDLEKLRGFEWYYLWRLCHRELLPKPILEPGLYGGVFSMDFSADGRLFAWGWGNHIQLWDAHTGKKLRRFEDDQSSGSIVVFSPDGRRLASGKANGAVRVLDVDTGREVWTASGAHAGRVNGVAYSPDGKCLATGGGDGKVILWVAETGQPLRTFAGKHKVAAVAFSPDGRWLATGEGETVFVRELPTGDEVRTFRGPRQRVNSLAFSSDGRRLAAGSADRSVRVWDAHSGELIELVGHSHEVTSVAFSPDGRRLASGSQSAVLWPDGELLGSGSSGIEDSSCKVWDIETRQELLSLQTQYLRPSERLEVGYQEPKGVHGTRVLFSPDGSRLACGYVATSGIRLKGQAVIKVWDAVTPPEPQSLVGGAKVTSLHFSPDGRWLASASEDKRVRVWQVNRGSERDPMVKGVRHTLTGHNQQVTCVRYSPNSPHLASACMDGTIRVCDGTTGESISNLSGPPDGVTCLAYSPDGRSLAGGGLDGIVKIWDLGSGQMRQTFKGHLAAITCLAFSPDGKHLASGSDDHGAKIWDTQTGGRLPLPGHTKEVRSVAFSPDGRYLASGGADRRVYVWDARSGEIVFDLTGHTGSVTGAVFHPDGKRLASAAEDRTIKLWDLATGRELVTLKGHPAPVTSLDFSPSGELLATGSNDGTVKIWDARPVHEGWLLLVRPKASVGRN